MKTTHTATADQARAWNGGTAQAWIVMQQILDRTFEPFADLLVEAVTAGGGGRVLDVGCGTGATTLAVARNLTGGGHCTGIDISDPMIGVARGRARSPQLPVRFVVDDAETHQFDAGSFDTVVSRFGVMFFGDPIAAFANLRRAARTDAQLQFFAWRSPDENPFMTTAERAAAPLLPTLALRRPGLQGPFAFADADRLASILEPAGWTDIDITPIDVGCTLAEEELVPYLTHMGPVGQILHGSDEQTRSRVVAAIRPAHEQFVHDGEVRYTAACWSVSARNRARPT
ncbi:class I SAM-dependent methyltransferase [Mycolicibacterium sp. YH-1]|uniref:class I SAM-dependent methyltransferase n=1 Tax=Mycolicibacterium sp. YH-1 TaxID=2908837 RepID=UPI001F4BEA62|nr:class I SAM-dependent methyltransferase [Mycolicibacterium sp. YH-1]UNB54908.1 class I SAM-dependent methyltransferase [Mycolicibacterium sp. YH-1]